MSVLFGPADCTTVRSSSIWFKGRSSNRLLVIRSSSFPLSSLSRCPDSCFNMFPNQSVTQSKSNTSASLYACRTAPARSSGSSIVCHSRGRDARWRAIRARISSSSAVAVAMKAMEPAVLTLLVARRSAKVLFPLRAPPSISINRGGIVFSENTMDFFFWLSFPRRNFLNSAYRLHSNKRKPQVEYLCSYHDQYQQCHYLRHFLDSPVAITGQSSNAPGYPGSQNQCRNSHRYPYDKTNELSRDQHDSQSDDACQDQSLGRDSLVKRSSQTSWACSRKNAQHQHHGPACRRQRDQQGKWEGMYSYTGEKRKFEQQYTHRTKHSETSYTTIAHHL